MRGIPRFMMLITALFVLAAYPLRAAGEEPGYSTPQEIGEAFEEIEREHKDYARLHILGETAGGREIMLLELGDGRSNVPAVLVIANMTGDCPLASEAALELARRLAGDWREDIERTRWYIIPAGNPDGYSNYFKEPLGCGLVNASPLNDDGDEAVDEDGPEDLNGDGYVTVMRQVHPGGRWMKVEGNPVLMKKADPARGESGG